MLSANGKPFSKAGQVPRTLLCFYNVVFAVRDLIGNNAVDDIIMATQIVNIIKV